jgi:DNA helicase-2/ATP-dependent DNA helicase PcrA
MAINLDELNISQRKAVTFNGKHLLVLAGAGTGKTKTIISRASYLIESGVSPEKIQILTFTKRAANEIVSRVKASLNSADANTLNGSTFHSWCNQLLSRFPNLFGTKDFTVIDQDDQLGIMKIACGKNNLQFESLKLKPQSLLDLYSFARNTNRNLSTTLRYKLFNDIGDEAANQKILLIKPKIEIILKAYELKKTERKYLDYDDIIQVVASRLNKDENVKRVIGSRYEHILVDEMQDTNPLQWTLLNPLQEICHLYCVGDDAQSIYSFRGADFKNVHLFRERVKDAEVFRLEDNYRSTQEILDISNWLLENSTINYNKKLNAVRGTGIKPSIINVDNEWDEANWIADKIIENFTKNNKLYSDHLVLSRSQFYTRALQAIFIERKIPFTVYGGRKFMESAHIKDVISALRVSNNIYDELGWIRFLMLWEGIGEIKASKYIADIFEKKDVHETIDLLFSLMKEPDNKNIPLIVESIVKNKNDVSIALSNAYGIMKNRLAKIYAQDWERKREPDFPILKVLASNFSTLGEFITECILDGTTSMESSHTVSENKDHVVISTIHSAKGLEADICFVLNVGPGSFPSTWSLGNVDEIEEERRTLYVALTRAKNELIVTRPKHSVYGGFQRHDDKNNNEVDNYFLNSLPENLANQQVIKVNKNDENDIDQLNSNDISYGMDFN